MDLKLALVGVEAFFEGEAFQIGNIVGLDTPPGQRQEDECPPFDHCYVDQRKGFLGDDHYGTVYFCIGDGDYLAVNYQC